MTFEVLLHRFAFVTLIISLFMLSKIFLLIIPISDFVGLMSLHVGLFMLYIARDELHESEANEASVFCFDNTSPEKPCFVDGLVCFISLCLRVFQFQNATRRE